MEGGTVSCLRNARCLVWVSKLSGDGFSETIRVRRFLPRSRRGKPAWKVTSARGDGAEFKFHAEVKERMCLPDLKCSR